MPAPESPPSDSNLLELSRAGDFHAFRGLVDRYYPRLMATAVGMLGPGTDAETAVQDAFLRFYRAIGRFEGRSSLGTYLTRIVMNQSLKILRKRRIWSSRFISRDDPDRVLAEPTQDPDTDRLENEEKAARIREVVQKLKPEFRSVVVLRFLNGCSTEECADILKIPPGTVMSRLSRALDKLAPMLKNNIYLPDTDEQV